MSSLKVNNQWVPVKNLRDIMLETGDKNNNLFPIMDPYLYNSEQIAVVHNWDEKYKCELIIFLIDKNCIKTLTKFE